MNKCRFSVPLSAANPHSNAWWWAIVKKCCLAALLIGKISAAQAAPEPGTVFKDWTVGCEQTNGAEIQSCYIFQNLVLKEGGQRILHVAVGQLSSNKKPAAIITFPLGISLPPGVSIRIDEGETRKFGIERCHTNGCIGAVGLDEKIIEELKGGQQAHIGFHDTNRREILIPVSLKGFTAGYKSLR